MEQHERYSVSLLLILMLIVLLPITVHATPSIQIAVTPPNQTVGAGQPAFFEISVTNTGDTTLESIVVSSVGIPECGGQISGLMQGGNMAWTCTHVGETGSYWNDVSVTANASGGGAKVMGNASARVTVVSQPAGGQPGYPSASPGSPVVRFDSVVSEIGARMFPILGPLIYLSVPEVPPTTDTDKVPDSGSMDNFEVRSTLQTDVFTRGEGGGRYFYSPSIESVPDGSMVAFADAVKLNFSDPAKGYLDMDLVYRRSTDGGESWGPLVVLEDPGDLWAAFNSASLVDRATGRLWIFYVRASPGRGILTSRPGTDDMENLARWSDDNGLTWSAPRDLTTVARDLADPTWNASIPGPGGAIQTSKGRLLVPMWKEPAGHFVIFSDNHGRTWGRGTAVPGDTGGSENQLAELSDGRIRMEYRQGSGPNRWITESADGGETWSMPRPGWNVTPVNCALLRIPLRNEEGEHDCLLWTGPVGPPIPGPIESNPFTRWRLTMRVSCDQGMTFPAERQISEDAASYSDMTDLGNHTVGLLWERGLQTPDEFITFARLAPGFGTRAE